MMKIDVKTEAFWNQEIPFENKFIIAGPCSVESEDQLLRTARKLKKYDVSLMRAGIWKPRTRPGSFEGIGTKGLKWLKSVSSELRLAVAVEVANAQQVEECLEHEIDVFWLGARTTTNPFSVQAIADALKGVDIPIMIKNPINPDIELWIGAFERLRRAGTTRLIAIHRGFSIYHDHTYRNQPIWSIPIELRRRMPNIPLICDPSHICGKSELILAVAQKAMDLLYDGLMIEVHINPKRALSDAGQQVTPEAFGDLLSHLKIRRASAENPDCMDRINFHREEIDEIDSQIIELLARRMDISRQIALHKKKNNISTFQPHRWQQVIEGRIKEGVERKLSKAFILDLYQQIHEESISQQQKIIDMK